MAIALDTSTSSSDNSGSATSLTWSHTCTGTNLILIVTVSTTPQTDKVSGVTYNGVAMTRVGYAGNSGSQSVASYMYYLLNPATGAHNIVVSVPSNSTNITGDAISYTGVLQSGQPDSYAVNNTSTGTTLDLTTTVVATGCWLISTYWNANVRTKPSGTTDRGTNGMTVDSNGTVSSGSRTHQWTTDTNNSAQAGVIASISPVPDNFNALPIFFT